MHALRGVVALYYLAGCDAVFGLQRNDGASDASADDASAVPACPAVGTDLVFSTSLRLERTGCSELTGSTAGHVAALCNGQIHSGPELALMLPQEVLKGTMTDHFDVPRMAPDGDTLYVRHWTNATVHSRILEFAATASNVWSATHDVWEANRLDTSARFGTPAPVGIAGNHRMFVRNFSTLAEIEFDVAGTGSMVASYTAQDLGVDTVTLAPNLTADGLRIIFGGVGTQTPSGVYIAERETVVERFGPAKLISGVPYVFDPWLDPRCTRLYLSLQNTVYSLERQ
ncbi:MAG: hypothetical protein H0T46_31640 [Deltaproteobacteria bacterium]|nr:hypothetical protein [Deltaproteobacteria bacterium]